MVETPSIDDEYSWLTVVKYMGYGISLILLFIFVLIVLLSP